jgi:UDP-N-acetylmuramate dehydrogenase
LAPFTTFDVGGLARYFVEAVDEETIAEVFDAPPDSGVFVLGGGSNVLIADRGFEGLVLKIALKNVEFSAPKEGKVRVTANAGEDWDDFVALCVSKDLAGVECLSGIPGLVGGTPIQNVGAYGQEVSETIVSVRVLERSSRRIFEIENADCGFEYRKSIFNGTERDRYVVLSVTYELELHGKPKIAYADLKDHFQGRVPSLSEVREGVRRIRRSKGMLVRQGGTNANSAGSFFKNPVVSERLLGEVADKAVSLGFISEPQQMPRFTMEDGNYKIPAAWLIEKSGFHKGFESGRTGISGAHSLALINRGGATASEICGLKKTIEEVIFSNFGLVLMPEPNFIGFEHEEETAGV